MTRTRHVFRVEPDDADDAPPGALARAGHAATALRADDAETERVRTLLAGLRPDYPDPWEPMGDPASGAAVMIVRSSPRAPWDVDVPRGLGSALGALSAETQTRDAADVLADIATLPRDAAVVLRWLRQHASLASGVRGLWVDAGQAFASSEQRRAWKDLTARRAGAAQHGRRIVLAAAVEWESLLRRRGV